MDNHPERAESSRPGGAADPAGTRAPAESASPSASSSAPSASSPGSSPSSAGASASSAGASASSAGPSVPDSLEIATRLLGRPQMMPRRQVSAAAGASLLSARRFWHALGFPRVGDDDTMFTDADLSALTTVVRLVRQGELDESTALAMTRAVALSADRLTDWQVSVLREMLSEPGAAGEGTNPSTATAVLLLELADQLERLTVYAWRRHLTAAVSQLVAEARPDTDEAVSVRTIGFADMVEFTPLVRRLSERELTSLVQRFYTLATDVVTAHGGRVIKTIGDEVVFVSELAGPSAAIALDLVEELREDPVMPQLRVGIATGPVTAHLGDVFGTTVNRASRMTAAAHPGTVLMDDATASALAAVSGFRMLRLRTRTLRGLGPTRLWVLRRATETTRRGLWHEIIPGGIAPDRKDFPDD